MAVSAAFDQSDAGNGVLPILQGRFSKSAQILSSVMPGHSRSKDGVALLAYVPGIHIFLLNGFRGVDGRDKPGHDDNVW